MRLINIHTLKLEEFFEQEIPPYAILSHRWTSEEVPYKAMAKGRADETTKGYIKLVGACEAAKNYEVEYLWMDTCCIDKRSSAELSEAINSMWKWYQNSKICLVYLADANPGDTFETSLRNSVWRSRCWTLQELLAPATVGFFDSTWTYVGSKSSDSALIEDVTGISRLVLTKTKDIFEFPIAVRMSWAAHRVSTREEDVAYSLMGIFDVNIPPLYGEGQKAFGRLQEEIINRTRDSTFLLWGLSNTSPRLLARSPADFDVVRGKFLGSWSWNHANAPRSFELTRSGLGLHGFDLVRLGPYTYGVPIIRVENMVYMLALRKHESPEDLLYRVGIHECPPARLDWCKTRQWTVSRGDLEQQLQKLQRLTWEPPKSFGFDITHGFTQLVVPAEHQDGPLNSVPIHVSQVGNTGSESSTLSCKFPPLSPNQASLICTVGNGQTLSIDLSFDFDSRPCALLYQDSDLCPRWTISDANRDSLFFRKTHSHHVCRISDGIAGLHTTRTSGTTHDWFECEMITSGNEETEGVSAFWRASSLEPTFARVPDSLLLADLDLFVSLIPPNKRGLPRPEFWGFRISSENPSYFVP